MSFKCDKCGECCRNLGLSDLYGDLDSGNGVCRYLIGNLCSIYENRPLKCRVEESYCFFEEVMSKEEYYAKNYEVCAGLKQKAKRKNK